MKLKLEPVEPDIKRASSSQELRYLLTDLKQRGKLPLMIAVSSASEFHWIAVREFYGIPTGSVIAITDYDISSGTFTIQSQWDAGAPPLTGIPLSSLGLR
jgi:hypothetical protein